MAVSKIPIMDVTDELIAYEKGNLRFTKQGNVVSFYAVMNNLGSGTDVTVGTSSLATIIILEQSRPC